MEKQVENYMETRICLGLKEVCRPTSCYKNGVGHLNETSG